MHTLINAILLLSIKYVILGSLKPIIGFSDPSMTLQS